MMMEVRGGQPVDLLGEKEQKELEAARAHVDDNRRPFEAAVDCIDDRGLRAGRKRPGAHFGYVMILLSLRDVIKERTGLGLTPEMAVDSVKATVEEAGETFSMHTDKHADPEGDPSPNEERPLIGCAHINLAANVQYRRPYNIDPTDVVRAVSYARSLHENGEIELMNLDGEHGALGIIIVAGSQKTVIPYDPETNRRYFVYDRERDKAFIKDVLIPGLAKHGISGFTFKEFSEIDDRQRNMTSSVVGEDLPIFEGNFDGSTSQLEFVGRLPKI